jgi:ketosteroid isomerase-like protein
MNEKNPIAEAFFQSYRRALLDRDAVLISSHYAVPALIEFPDQPIPVTSSAQAEEFFAGAFDQYQGVTEAKAAITVVASTTHSVWADVTWSYDGDVPGERNVYQLVRTGDEWKIAVLTPMDS